MGKLNIAIVGLGRVGTGFLYGIISQKDKGINIIAVSEQNDTTGKNAAMKAGIKNYDIDNLIKLGNKLDIIFDLTGNSEVRKVLRELLESSNNRHTVIAPENVARLVWSLITNKPLPDVHTDKGY
ncbi:MAG: NAD(P)-binding domain-containing protein [Spirochaetota bacterium]|nr:NAD(P)-binding domain-containing protein [Spirochaetota bacterium]